MGKRRSYSMRQARRFPSGTPASLSAVTRIRLPREPGRTGASDSPDRGPSQPGIKPRPRYGSGKDARLNGDGETPDRRRCHRSEFRARRPTAPPCPRPTDPSASGSARRPRPAILACRLAAGDPPRSRRPHSHLSRNERARRPAASAIPPWCPPLSSRLVVPGQADC